jgi:hypothetical protein
MMDTRGQPGQDEGTIYALHPGRALPERNVRANHGILTLGTTHYRFESQINCG